jgi:hypothetical protein
MAMASPHFSAATFGDPVLNQRLRLLTADLLSHPGCSLPQACRSEAALKGAYRFFAHPDTSVANLLPAFVLPSVAALCRRREVLAVHDTTTCNFSHLAQASGLGYINDSQTAKGIHLHSSLLLDDDCKLVGIAELQFWVRPGFRQETDEEIRNLPIEAKESHKWLLGMRSTHDAFEQASPRPPRLIHVMDREGDIHEVFQEVRCLGDDAVIRCAQNRRVEAEQPEQIDYAKQRVAGRESLGTMELRVPLKEGGYRTAVVEARSLEVRLRPDEAKHKGRRPLKLGLVEVREISTPPAGEEAAQWWLWTTLHVRKLKQVKRVLKIYRARWRVEDYHRALKTGCQVESLRLQEGESLMKAIALQAWVATRLVRLRDEAKNDPEQDCEVCFSQEEWQLLWVRQHGRVWREADGKPKLGEVVKWLARLGGYLGRKNDPVPGAECLGKALYALDLLLQGRDLGRTEVAAEREKVEKPKTGT